MSWNPIISSRIDQVKGISGSIFSNVLVLSGQSFVGDESGMGQTTPVSVRGRDLRGAELARADLRNVDFSGANLNDANLFKARMQGASLSCIQTSARSDEIGRTIPIDLRPPEKETWPADGCTWFQGANLEEAELEGTSLNGAKLQGANFSLAKLQAASFKAAWLDGASFLGANLEAASFVGAELDGVAFNGAQLQGVNVKGALLDGVGLGFTFLILRRSECTRGCRTLELPRTEVWRLFGKPASAALASVDGVDATKRPFAENSFASWRQAIIAASGSGGDISAVEERLSALNPQADDPPDVFPPEIWNELDDQTVPEATREKALFPFFLQLACSRENSPYVARGLIKNEILRGTRIAATEVHR